MKSIDPSPEQFQKEISEIPKGVPVVMLNLLKFRDRALYSEGESGVPGKDAYALYSEKAIQHVQDVGGTLVWMGKAVGEVIAPPDETWDEVFLVRYPAIEKFFEMVMTPPYQECLKHRTAALEDSRLIAMVEHQI